MKNKIVYVLMTLMLVTSCLKSTVGGVRGVVVFVSGDVTVNSNAIGMNYPVGESDEIITGENGRVDIAVKTDETNFILRVNPGSRINIRRLTERNTDIDTVRSDIFLSVRKMSPDSSMSVSSPTAVASVRGTEFYMRSIKDMTSLYVNSGKVEVLSGINSYVVGGGDNIVVRKIDGVTTVSKDEMFDQEEAKLNFDQMSANMETDYVKVTIELNNGGSIHNSKIISQNGNILNVQLSDGSFITISTDEIKSVEFNQ